MISADSCQVNLSSQAPVYIEQDRPNGSSGLPTPVTGWGFENSCHNYGQEVHGQKLIRTKMAVPLAPVRTFCHLPWPTGWEVTHLSLGGLKEL